MARQWSIFSFADGTEPSPPNEISFGYHADRPGSPVKVRFPAGERTLTPDKLAELGVLLIALAGKCETDKTDDLLDQFGLDRPFFVNLDDLAEDASRKVTDAMIDTMPAVRRQYGDNPKPRGELVRCVAGVIAKTIRSNGG